MQLTPKRAEESLPPQPVSGIVSCEFSNNDCQIVSLLLDHLARTLFFKVKVTLNTQAECPVIRFELIQGKVTPLVIGVSKDGSVSKAGARLRIILRRIPCTCTDGIEKLGNDKRIRVVLLRTYLGKSLLKCLGHQSQINHLPS